MTYTDEEIVRELEYRYPECPLVREVCERLLELSAEQEARYILFKEDGDD